MRRRPALAVLVACCIGACAAAEPPREAAACDPLCPYPFIGEPPTSRGPLASASALLGAQVKDEDGRDLGRVTDLVLDPAAPSVRYAVLLKAKDEQRRAVPLSALQPGLGRRLLLVTPPGHASAGGGQPPGPLVAASALIGRAVEVPGHGTRATIADVLVELETAHAPYALVRFEGDAAPSRAIALDALQIDTRR